MIIPNLNINKLARLTGLIAINIAVLFNPQCVFASKDAPHKAAQSVEFKVLSFNVWHEGTQVSGGYQAIINEIERLQPDLISLAEVRNYSDDFTKRLASDLAKRGLKYNTYHSSRDVGILSLHPIDSWRDLDYFTRATINIKDARVVFYSGHLDYQNYASVLPRGYDGNSYKEITPVIDAPSVLKMNNNSKRPAGVKQMIEDAKQEINQGKMVIVAGDFNEPSHQDWTAREKDLFDHNGAIIPWTSTKLLTDAGYLDSWRTLYPDASTHPGFTWVTGESRQKKPEDVRWLPKADERDRIDFIFYHQNPDIALNDVKILGPTYSVISDHYGSRWQEENGEDREQIISPLGFWPSDHKAVLATFTLEESAQAEKPVAVAGHNFNVTGTTDVSRAYELNGSNSKNAVSYHWSIVNKTGNFWLQEKHAGPWVSTVKQAKARALIPANTSGEVTYQLVVKDKAGVPSEPSTVTVRVDKAEQTDNDQAFINSATLISQDREQGDTVLFERTVSASGKPDSHAQYFWTLPAAPEVSGQATRTLTLQKGDREQQLSGSVRIVAGKHSRILKLIFSVPAKNKPGQDYASAYSKNQAYPTKCTRVSHKGQIWHNQWYVNAGQEEPGSNGAWGAWRVEGASNNSCR